MSKRSKSKKKRVGSANEVFRYGPIEARCSGKAVYLRNTVKPEESADFKRQLGAAFSESVQHLREETARVEDTLAKYDPLAVMGYFIMREGAIDPDTYKEYE